MLLSDFLLGVAQDLNDAEPGYEFSRWTKGQLLRYLNEAIALIALFKSDYFAAVKVIKLVPGEQQRACCCAQVTQIIGQSDEFGNLIGGALPQKAPAALFRWTKKGCPQAGDFKLNGYWMDPSDSRAFFVSPAVPPEQDIYLKINCIEEPPVYTEGQFTAEFTLNKANAAAAQWVLFRAMMIDDESATTMQAAAAHLNLFFNLLQVQYRREMIQKIGALVTDEAKEKLQLVAGLGGV